MSSALRVKICGLKTLEHALAAVEAGADLLGFNFYPPSPRFISVEECRRICQALRQRGVTVRLVGVFVNPSLAEVEDALQRCGLDLAQLSGAESPELLTALAGRAFKGLRPASAGELEQALAAYLPPAAVPAWLVDAYHPALFGGTGQTGDWSLAAGLARRVSLLLAGGLTARNVAQAVEQVQPWGVDVASGVESAPGVKDPHKIRQFIRAAKAI